MLEDVNTGILWVTQRIITHKGDPDNIVLVGQSAGGHLGALALIRQVRQSFATRLLPLHCSERDTRLLVPKDPSLGNTTRAHSCVSGFLKTVPGTPSWSSQEVRSRTDSRGLFMQAYAMHAVNELKHVMGDQDRYQGDGARLRSTRKFVTGHTGAVLCFKVGFSASQSSTCQQGVVSTTKA